MRPESESGGTLRSTLPPSVGTTVSVPTLGGPVDLKVPPDSEAGRKLRLRGRGLPGQPPGDVRAKLAIPLEFAYAGGQQTIGVDGRTLQVKIPAGIRPGQVIRLGGQGQQGPGGRRSDLLLEIEYKPHGEFEVDGRNILYTVSLAPWDAALGTTVSVPTLGGKVDLRVPPDSDTGRKLRLRGRGLPGKPEAGDQIVEIEVTAPRAETDEQRELYRRMAEQFGARTRA